MNCQYSSIGLLDSVFLTNFLMFFVVRIMVYVATLHNFLVMNCKNLFVNLFL